MKIVVLAGGTSTEREISIVSGTGICGALRQKGHEAILVDIFCGVENVDWENPFSAEYDVEKAAEYMSSFNPQIKLTMSISVALVVRRFLLTNLKVSLVS